MKSHVKHVENPKIKCRKIKSQLFVKQQIIVKQTGCGTKQRLPMEKKKQYIYNLFYNFRVGYLQFQPNYLVNLQSIQFGL